MREVIHSRYSDASLQKISDHIGFFLGILSRVRVRMISPYEFDRQNPDFSAAAGLYRVTGDHKDIVLTRRHKYKFRHILAVLAHEYTHNYLHHRQILKTDQLENEYLTDTAAVYLGFGEVLLKGYEPFSWFAGIERRGYQNYHITQTMRIGYIEPHNIRFALAHAAKLRNEPDLLEALPVWDWHRISSLPFEVPVRLRKKQEKRQMESLFQQATATQNNWQKVKTLSQAALESSKRQEVPKVDAEKLMALVQALSMGDFELGLAAMMKRVKSVERNRKAEEAVKIGPEVHQLHDQVQHWLEVVIRYSR